MTLDINIATRPNGTVVVSLTGKLAESSFIQLDEKLAETMKSMPKKLCFNLAGLDYISSMGIRVILKTRKAVEGAGGQVIMTNLQPQIKKVFDIVAVLPKESVFASIEEADHYFAAMQDQETSRQGKH